MMSYLELRGPALVSYEQQETLAIHNNLLLKPSSLR